MAALGDLCALCGGGELGAATRRMDPGAKNATNSAITQKGRFRRDGQLGSARFRLRLSCALIHLGMVATAKQSMKAQRMIRPGRTINPAMAIAAITQEAAAMARRAAAT